MPLWKRSKPARAFLARNAEADDCAAAEREVALGVGEGREKYEPMGDAYDEAFVLATEEEVIFVQGSIFGAVPEDVVNRSVGALPDPLDEFLPSIISDTIEGHFLRLSLTFHQKTYICESFPVFADAKSKRVAYVLIRIYLPMPKTTHDLIAALSNDVRYGAYAEEAIALRFRKSIAACD